MARLLVCELRINGAQGGRSEKYYKKGSDNADPAASESMTWAKQLSFGRTAFFGSEGKLVYARVSRIGKPPDKETVELDYPLGPHPSWGTTGGIGDTLGSINDDNVCVFQCFQLAGSAWANHYYNFVPDSWVAGQILNPGVRDYFNAAATTPAGDMTPTGGLSHKDVCQAFWRYLIDTCTGVAKVTSTNYTEKAITRIVYRNITEHRIGAFFPRHRGRRLSGVVS